MAIFAMSDLHLPLGIDKPMDVFGSGWENYVERISENWKSTVKETDTVLIGGDVSWATYLEEALPDFHFIENLPGRKLISKGNHDYWWTTAAKLSAFLTENQFKTITFLHNSSVLSDGYAICACRGWKSPFESDFNGEDRKIYEREMMRLQLSLKEGEKLSEKRIVMMHYPPDVGFAEILDEYNVEFCVYGHLHGRGAWNKFAQSERDLLVSADYLSFMPKCIVE
ncbi:MAG: serine/threonine protein phosphatase [Ruminococcaceae bacterium]|nr:serine/threonine protein phosphatase [Oscillospiraceae bacterium]